MSTFTRLILFILSITSQATLANMQTINTNSLAEEIAILGSRNIYFGHQSVGQNIIDGVKDLLAATPDTTLQLLAMDETFASPVNKGHLIHSAIGENTKPVSKCEDFDRIIRTRLANTIDIALLKFCYIDINEDTDIVELFQSYRAVMDKLIQDFPDVTFVHVTTPLRHSASGPGVWIRELLGRPNRSKLDNIKRHEFNQLLKSHYADDPLFDLATSMATTAEGKLNTFAYNAKKNYPNLVGNYTDDGGHLNETGRKKVAADFIRSLARLITR